LRTGLIRKRPIFICGLDLARRGSEIITLGLGTVALITRDGALIASENLPLGLPRKALVTPNQSDILIKAKVHREYCWDNWILRPDYVEERINHLVSSGFGLVVMRLNRAPNLLKMYRRAIMDSKIRLSEILDRQYEISTSPTLVSIIEIKAFGKGKPFWSYANRGCIAGNYINNALSTLGFRVV